MSYCEFSEESDVHMHSNGDQIICVACRISKKVPVKTPKGKTFWQRPDVSLVKRDDALKHLLLHHVRGHKVPNHAIKTIQEEIKKHGNTI